MQQHFHDTHLGHSHYTMSSFQQGRNDEHSAPICSLSYAYKRNISKRSLTCCREWWSLHSIEPSKHLLIGSINPSVIKLLASLTVSRIHNFRRRLLCRGSKPQTHHTIMVELTLVNSPTNEFFTIVNYFKLRKACTADQGVGFGYRSWTASISDKTSSLRSTWVASRISRNCQSFVAPITTLVTSGRLSTKPASKNRENDIRMNIPRLNPSTIAP